MDPSSPRPPQLVVLRPWMLLALLLVPAALTVLVLRITGPAPSPDPSQPISAPALPPPAPTGVNDRIGPWGNLTLTPITIQPPVRLIPPKLYTPAPIYWFVGRADEKTFRDLLTVAGVDPAEHNPLIDSLKQLPDGQFRLEVQPGFLRSLRPPVRAAFYRSLLRLDYRNRDVFGGKRWSPGQWTEIRASLPANVGDLVAEFIFPASGGTDVHFWDLALALHYLPAENDRIALTRSLNRQRTFLLSLNFEPGAKINDIASYWRLSTTRRQIIPMLESLAALPYPSNIDALHLMPPFVREHAYTYPISTLTARDNDAIDCFWTCANFDRKVGEEPIAISQSAAYLTSNYVSYVGRPEFGDIIVLRDSEDNALHVAVHIADNIVFTKNGKHPLMPWVFMEREEMLRLYELADPQKTIWVRRATD